MFDAATLAQLADALADEMAARLAPQIAELAAAGEDRWLDTRGAAEYLGLSVGALHKLTGADAIPYSQDCAGGKCWYLRSQLDQWRLESARGPA